MRIEFPFTCTLSLSSMYISMNPQEYSIFITDSPKKPHCVATWAFASTAFL